jgi:hypothetical protein
MTMLTALDNWSRGRTDGALIGVGIRLLSLQLGLMDQWLERYAVRTS